MNKIKNQHALTEIPDELRKNILNLNDAQIGTKSHWTYIIFINYLIG